MTLGARLLASGTGAAFSPAALGRIPGEYGQDDLLPGGAKIRGANIVPAEGTWAQGSAGDGWSVLWEFWDPDWIADNLDDAVDFGCNVVRTMGSIRGIWLGNYTRETYLDHWDELNLMCRNRGLHLFPVGNPGGVEIDGIPYATVEAEMVAFAQRANTWRTCIGIDVVQEDHEYGAGTDGQNLLAALREVTEIPLTYSVIGGTPSQLGHADNTQAVIDLNGTVDFHSFHWYYSPGVTDIETFWWDAGAGTPIVIGEYGSPDSAGDAAQTARYEAIAATISYEGDSSHRPAGAFAWCLRDFGDDPATEMWGLSEADGTRRTHIVTPFEAIPKV